MSSEETQPIDATPVEGQDLFDAHELRVLAVLAEKEALTPDNYPLSLNALVNGCNQLSSREPVMTLSEEDVQQALQRLMQERFVAEVNQSGARVPKYEHRLRVKWVLEQDKLAVLVILMLRGPQTAGEIRARCGRLQEFASLADVEACLQFLIDKYPPLVAKLTRAPGSKEARYAQLLSGDVDLPMAASEGVEVVASVSRNNRIAELEHEVAALKAEVAALTEQFGRFRSQFE
ncbi:YceH family protein [Oxalicibacterium solurbis]|uniref:UPF0502 protein n=1 Tax=Oxalicibacterium solurbis TaxID=69280 RepID=A0A8J3AYM2_9BURK|nr:YceH family protein [Oxalicibacterium solurbis]GGI54536.1 UPF0502 protein [Oxalicibacterium solurbis]